MGAVIAHSLAARTDTGDWHGDDKRERDLIPLSCGQELTRVVHKRARTSYRSFALQEIGKPDGHGRSTTTKPSLDRLEQLGQRPDRYLTRMLRQDLEEPAHVGALD